MAGPMRPYQPPERELSAEEKERLSKESGLLDQEIRIKTAAADEAEIRASSTKIRNLEDQLRYEKSQLDFEMVKLRASQEKDRAAVQKILDGGHGVFDFDQPIMPAAVAPFLARLTRFSGLNPGADITIVINSPGGSFAAGMRLIGEIRTLAGKGHRIITVISGEAASMAGILAQAGDHRVIHRGSKLMIHKGGGGVRGATHDLEDAIEGIKQANGWVVKMYAERSSGKTTAAFINRKILRRDWYLWAEEALERGFVDEITGTMPGGAQ